MWLGQGELGILSVCRWSSNTSPMLWNSPLHWNYSVTTSHHGSAALVPENYYTITHLHLFYARHLTLLHTVGRICVPCTNGIILLEITVDVCIHYDIFLIDGRKVTWGRKIYIFFIITQKYHMVKQWLWFMLAVLKV